MAYGHWCARCGWSERCHIDIREENKKLKTAIRPGYHESLEGCHGFIVSQKVHRKIEALKRRGKFWKPKDSPAPSHDVWVIIGGRLANIGL